MSGQAPTIAIIGGGISGLVCAARLGQLGLHNVSVFDTGRNAVGGRCSSKDVIINGQAHRFDHSAQYFTVSDPKFAKIVSFLHKNGAVKIWSGHVGHIGRSREFTRNHPDKQCFIGTNGMRSIAECLAGLVNVKRPVWVGDVSWDSSMKKWNIPKQGFFDYLVIAHNGKCADKLMSNAGTTEVHSLLQVRFSDRVNPRDRKMTLSSLWVLMVAFPKSLGLKFEGAHVEGDPDLTWISNNSAKLNEHNGASNTRPQSKQLECWTLISSASFGKANKVPQEMIPPKKEAEIVDKLLTALARVTGLRRESLQPTFTKAQLWGAAVPLNTLQNKERCVFDGLHNVGVCGDWLTSPCIEGAAVSGLDLAELIYKHAAGNTLMTSLTPDFKTVQDSAIGSFPTDAKMLFKPT